MSSSRSVSGYQLSRRALLAGLAASSAGSGQTHSIIDTHIHLYDPARPQGIPWPPKTDELLYRPVLPPEYLSLTRPLGVSGAIVVEASAWLEDNQWVLDLAKDNPFIVGVVGNLQPEGFAENLARFGKNALFRGIRIGGGVIAKRVGDRAFLDNLKRLADRNLSLDAIGTAAMLEPLLRVTDAVPNLRVAIDHMPVEPVGWPEARAQMVKLAARPAVFAKVSGVLKNMEGKTPTEAAAYRPSLDQVWEMFGPNRVMYGSNWPVSNRLAPYDKVLGVMRQYVDSKGSDAARMYFVTNSKSCYRWPG